MRSSFPCLLAILFAVSYGCNSAKGPAGGSAATGSAAAGSAQAAPHEMKDDRDSATFRSQPLSEILVTDYEGRPEEFVEAKKWLHDADHRLVKIPQATAEKLVADLYDAGALRVFATELTKQDEAVVSRSLRVVVSTVDDAARRRVLETRNAFYRSYLPTIGQEKRYEELAKADDHQPIVVIGLNY